MELTLHTEAMIRRYLLGDLTQDELEALELRLLGDADFLHWVSLMEEELVDEYVGGRLSSEERKKFESSFLCTPEGRREVSFAAGLRNRALEERNTAVTGEGVAAATPPGRSFLKGASRGRGIYVPRYVAAAAALLIMALGSALVFTVRHLRREIERLEAAQLTPGLREQELRGELSSERDRAEGLSAKLRNSEEERARLEQDLAGLRKAKPPELSGTLASIILTAGRARGTADGQRLTIDSGVMRASIQLVLRRADYDVYRVRLLNEQSAELWSASSLRARSYGNRKRIAATVPVSLMPDGDYSLKLYGITDKGEYVEADTYYFRTLRR